MSCPSIGSGRHDRAGHPIQHPIYCADRAVLGGLDRTESHVFARVGRFLQSSHGRSRQFESAIAHSSMWSSQTPLP